MSLPNALARDGRALLLIDFQNDFLEPKGRMPVCPAHVGPVLSKAREAMAEATRSDQSIAAIGNEFKRSDRLMNLLRNHASIEGSSGAGWTTQLPRGETPYFPKWASNAFVNPQLDLWLKARQVRTLALSGLKAKACITATAKGALERGYAVVLLGGAIACDSDASRAKAFAKLARLGAVIL